MAKGMSRQLRRAPAAQLGQARHGGGGAAQDRLPQAHRLPAGGHGRLLLLLAPPPSGPMARVSARGLALALQPPSGPGPAPAVADHVGGWWRAGPLRSGGRSATPGPWRRAGDRGSHNLSHCSVASRTITCQRCSGSRPRTAERWASRGWSWSAPSSVAMRQTRSASRFGTAMASPERGSGAGCLWKGLLHRLLQLQSIRRASARRSRAGRGHRSPPGDRRGAGAAPCPDSGFPEAGAPEAGPRPPRSRSPAENRCGIDQQPAQLPGHGGPRRSSCLKGRKGSPAPPRSASRR